VALKKEEATKKIASLPFMLGVSCEPQRFFVFGPKAVMIYNLDMRGIAIFPEFKTSSGLSYYPTKINTTSNLVRENWIYANSVTGKYSILDSVGWHIKLDLSEWSLILKKMAKNKILTGLTLRKVFSEISAPTLYENFLVSLGTIFSYIVKHTQGKALESQYKIHSGAISIMLDYDKKKNFSKKWQMEIEAIKAAEENTPAPKVEENDKRNEALQRKAKGVSGGKPKVRGLSASSGNTNPPQAKKRKEPSR
jgi:hypothetical protein